MCGIAGLILAQPGPIAAATVEMLSRKMAHRGPDDWGALIHGADGTDRLHAVEQDRMGQVMLLHRRLSILDLSAAGWQPMSSADGRYHIVYNGEVYNYRELREVLRGQGHVFRTDTDTEVVLAAWATWGVKALERFVGMFALALLDAKAGSVWLARDFFGIKPLYYGNIAGGLGFASEIPTLLSLPGIDRSLDDAAAFRYLRWGAVDGGEGTLLRGVRQVPPGCCLEVGLDRPQQPRLERYWAPDPSARSELSRPQAAARLRELFLTSVDLHLRSDVPVGAALSGGIDSSSIVCAIRRLRPEVDLHAISYVADDPRISEERWVEEVRAATGATLHKVQVSAEELWADIDSLVAVQGEPFGTTSIYASYRVYRAARERGLTVMLDGQGADELLAGYTPYRGARLVSLIRQGRLGEAAAFARRLARLPTGRGDLMNALNYAIPDAWQDLPRRLVGRGYRPAWIRPDWLERADARPLGRYLVGDQVLRKALIRDLGHDMVPHLLRYADRNAMAWSVENRVPFLTPQIAEFVLSLPEDYIVDGEGTTKSVFREAMRGLVPDSILDRKDKIGFYTPQAQWMEYLGRRIPPLLDQALARGCTMFDADHLRRGAFTSKDGWRVLNFLLWAAQHDVRFG